MSNYHTHESINLAVLIGLIVLFNFYLSTIVILWFVVGFFVCTFFITPDLDTDSRVYHRWKLLRFLWWPYKCLVKHRGISHNPILGPISFLWIMIIPAIIYPGYNVWVVVLGMVIAIELHILTDKYL